MLYIYIYVLLAHMINILEHIPISNLQIGCLHLLKIKKMLLFLFCIFAILFSATLHSWGLKSPKWTSAAAQNDSPMNSFYFFEMILWIKFFSFIWFSCHGDVFGWGWILTKLPLIFLKLLVGTCWWQMIAVIFTFPLCNVIFGDAAMQMHTEIRRKIPLSSKYPENIFIYFLTYVWFGTSRRLPLWLVSV